MPQIELTQEVFETLIIALKNAKTEHPTKMSSPGRELLIDLEGFKNRAYQDVSGLWTIGVGHLLTKSERTSGKIMIDEDAIYWRNGLGDHSIFHLLTQDLSRFEKTVLESVKVPLTQHQFDALASFAFNVGVSAFKKSTLLKVINLSHYNKVPYQMRRWVYSAGKKIKGLENRREKEIELWEGRYE